jgi:hypothetical protein
VYVIQRNDGTYVANTLTIALKGSSYTCKLQYAQVFATREQAQRELCPENETIVAVADILR